MIPMPRRMAKRVLIGFDAFLAATAVAGGIGLLTGAIAPGLDLLQGTPFHSYSIPGLVLLGVVGGSALAATLLMLRRHPYGVPASAFAGLMIVGFEIVEVLVVGSEPGVARTLQLFYFSLGLLIAVLSTVLWLNEQTVRFGSARHHPVP